MALPNRFLNMAGFHSSRQLAENIASLHHTPWESAVEQNMLESTSNNFHDIFFIKDSNGRHLLANCPQNITLRQASSVDPNNTRIIDIYGGLIEHGLSAREQRILATGVPETGIEETFHDYNRRKYWFISSIYPFKNTTGQVIGLIKICRDITDRKQSDYLRSDQADILELIIKNKQLDDILRRIIVLIETQIEGIYGSILLLDKDGHHLRACSAPSLPEAYVHLTDGLAIGPNVGSCGTAAFLKRPVIVADIETNPLWQDYVALVRPYGLRSCWSMPILSENGDVLATYGLYSKEVRTPTEAETALISMTTKLVGIAIERHLAEERIRFMALHDPLTNLPNRLLLKERLLEIISRPDARTKRVGIVFIDLDNFKAVNDSLGHGAGDQLLRVIADRMSACTLSTDMVCRLGGDEFVILLDELGTSTDEVIIRLQYLRNNIAEPIKLDGHSISMTASIGLVVFPTDGDNPELLLSNADAAMYSAKAAGRDNIQFYSQSPYWSE